MDRKENQALSLYRKCQYLHAHFVELCIALKSLNGLWSNLGC